MDNVDPSQSDSLVKVLSLPSSARDLRHLLTPTNLREVFDHPKEFILPKVPYLNFEGSRSARAKEWVQRCLLSRIQVAFEALT